MSLSTGLIDAVQFWKPVPICSNWEEKLKMLREEAPHQIPKSRKYTTMNGNWPAEKPAIFFNKDTVITRTVFVFTGVTSLTFGVCRFIRPLRFLPVTILQGTVGTIIYGIFAVGLGYFIASIFYPSDIERAQNHALDCMMRECAKIEVFDLPAAQQAYQVANDLYIQETDNTKKEIHKNLMEAREKELKKVKDRLELYTFYTSNKISPTLDENKNKWKSCYPSIKTEIEKSNVKKP